MPFVYLHLLSSNSWLLMPLEVNLCQRRREHWWMSEVESYILLHRTRRPTVILEAGAGSFSIHWALVQPEVVEDYASMFLRSRRLWLERPRPQGGHRRAGEMHILSEVRATNAWRTLSHNEVTGRD